MTIHRDDNAIGACAMPPEVWVNIPYGVAVISPARARELARELESAANAVEEGGSPMRTSGQGEE